jgi:hypothetical protein
MINKLGLKNNFIFFYHTRMKQNIICNEMLLYDFKTINESEIMELEDNEEFG